MSVFNTENLIYLLQGAGFSILVAIGALIIGVLLGTIFAAMRISKNKILNGFAFVYIQFVRGTPMLLQIMFLFLGFPTIYTAITGGRISMDPVIVGIIAIGINSGAYSAELIRSGIESIDKGQWEAAKTLGLNYKQTMQFIILPQAFRRLIPPFVSEFIMLIKDSSLIFAIGGLELLGRSKVISSKTAEFIWPLVFAAIIYLIMTGVVTYFSHKLERRYANND
ncbi:MAG: amino acid ABC transporter permease [Lachnospirales bacterium]